MGTGLLSAACPIFSISGSPESALAMSVCSGLRGTSGIGVDPFSDTLFYLCVLCPVKRALPMELQFRCLHVTTVSILHLYLLIQQLQCTLKAKCSKALIIPIAATRGWAPSAAHHDLCEPLAAVLSSCLASLHLPCRVAASVVLQKLTRVVVQHSSNHCLVA